MSALFDGTHRRLRKSGGFTLIELIIALTVLAVTMTAVFTIFSTGMKLRSATRQRLSFDRDARVLLSSLSDDLAHLMPNGPRPMVTSDSIVLWRMKEDGRSTDRTAVELVSYQWSGSSYQDSLLIRLATSLNIDITDSLQVHEQFVKWSRFPSLAPESSSRFLMRDDPGRRFGESATLRGLSGAWIAYPTIHDFQLEVMTPFDDKLGGDFCARLTIHLSPDPASNTIATKGRSTLAQWQLDASRDISMGLWVPMGLMTVGESWDNYLGREMP